MLDMETFGRRIAVLRRRAELKQGDVAKVCCVTVQAVSKWERGLSCPDALMLETLSRALGVSVQDFFCDPASQSIRKATDPHGDGCFLATDKAVLPHVKVFFHLESDPVFRKQSK